MLSMLDGTPRAAPPPPLVGIHHPSGDVKKNLLRKQCALHLDSRWGLRCGGSVNGNLGVTEPGLLGLRHSLIKTSGSSANCMAGPPPAMANVNNGTYDFYGRHGCVVGCVGVSTHLDPLNTGPNGLGTVIPPTRSPSPDAPCLRPATSTPKRKKTDGSCLIDDDCGVCGSREQHQLCRMHRQHRFATTMRRPPSTTALAFTHLQARTCDCDAEGNLEATLSANAASVFFNFEAAGIPETLDITLNWTNAGGDSNWASDLTLALVSPSGDCAALGGFNSSPAGCTSTGDYNLWPASWQSSSSGTYSASVDLLGNGLSGEGTWSVFLFNGFASSSGAQFDATWSISGLCNGGGPEEPNDCPPDLDGDGNITVSDALLLLGDFGCLSNCTADLNDDGQVTTSDMLVFLAAFGSLCD